MVGGCLFHSELTIKVFLKNTIEIVKRILHGIAILSSEAKLIKDLVVGEFCTTCQICMISEGYVSKKNPGSEICLKFVNLRRSYVTKLQIRTMLLVNY